MTDRFLFRAKRTDNREWVEGYYVLIDNYHYIYTGNLYNDGLYVVAERFEIDIDTLCPCTGLKDKNKKLIWENDVVKGKYYDKGISHRHIGQVKYICEAYKAVGVKQYTGYHASLDGSYEVIGNIFDNPELMHE